MNNIMKKAKSNHEIFEALYDAYKWSNRFNEKLLRVEDIRTGTCRSLHYSLEEEAAELRTLLKKASKKILYLNYLMEDELLTHHYGNKNSDLADMISDFIDQVNTEVKSIEMKLAV